MIYINENREVAPRQYRSGDISVSNLTSSRDMCARFGFYPVMTEPDIPAGKAVDWEKSAFTFHPQSEERSVTRWRYVSDNAEPHWESYAETETFDTGYYTAVWAYKDAPAAPEAVHRYSKYKLLDAIGFETWKAIKATLSEEQLERLVQCGELATDDPYFSAVLTAFRGQFPDADSILAAAEV